MNYLNGKDKPYVTRAYFLRHITVTAFVYDCDFTTVSLRQNLGKTSYKIQGQKFILNVGNFF